MPIICWGNLAKSADDTERIEQSIMGYVEGHNENVNAHQLEGSALYMHRVNERIDHLDGSVDIKKLAADSYLILSCFEEIGHWQSIGNVSGSVFGAGLYTNAVTNHICEVMMWDVGSVDVMDFSKNPFFQTTVFFDQITDQVSKFGCGRHTGAATVDSFGFKVVNGTLYAWWVSNGTEYTSEISGITLTDHNVYRAYIDSGLGKLYFYVNGELKVTVEENLPTVASEFMFFYNLRTMADARKDIHFCDLLIQVGR